MAHPDVLQEVAKERRSNLMTAPRTVPTTSEPTGRGRGCVSTLMKPTGRGRGRGEACSTKPFLVGTGHGRTSTTYITPHIARKFGRRDKSVLSAHEHDQRVLVSREMVKQSLSAMPAMRALTKEHVFNQQPQWRKNETNWQQAVAEATHSRTFDARSFRLPLGMLRQRASPSALASKLVAPASKTALEDLGVFLNHDHDVTGMAEDWIQLSSLLMEFCHQQLGISTRILKLGDDPRKWERFVVKGADVLARCPPLDSRIDPKIYGSSSKTRIVRRAWLADTCLKQLPKAEKEWQHELSAVVDAPGLVNPASVFDRDGCHYRRRVEQAQPWLHANPAFPAISPTKNAGKLICIYLALHKFAEDERKLRPGFTIEHDLQT